MLLSVEASEETGGLAAPMIPPHWQAGLILANQNIPLANTTEARAVKYLDSYFYCPFHPVNFPKMSLMEVYIKMPGEVGFLPGLSTAETHNLLIPFQPLNTHDPYTYLI
jgi:hypothetical protein